MKTLDFIFVGTSKNQAFGALENDYHQKITRYAESSITFIKDSSEKNITVKKREETKVLVSKLRPNDIVILCDETGKSFVTKKFAEKISQWQVAAQRVVFVVGGAYGVDLDVINAARRIKEKLKLSDFVFPHELARVVVLEQVYRALTILRGEKYHHE